LAEGLVGSGGGSVRAVILYGAHLLKTSPGSFSAYDFVVVVDDYGRFYREMKGCHELHRPTWVMTALSKILAPNVIAFTPDDGRHGIAKCLIVRKDHFERGLGPEPPDHFLLGRMVQKVALVWAASPEDEEWVEATLEGACSRVLDWVGPYLEGSFDAEAVGKRLLEVCYGAELRPEASNRSESVFEAQRDHFRNRLTSVLERGAASGLLERDGAAYRFRTPPSPDARRHWRRHLLLSKVRSTTRWFKHVVTFDNWLPYIARKVERRTGIPVELTPWERRAPLIFLWPRVIRVLRGRPEREHS